MDQAKCDAVYMSYNSTPPPAYNWLLFAPHEPCPASYLSSEAALPLKYPMPSAMLTPESMNSSASIDDLDAWIFKDQQQQQRFGDIFSPTLKNGFHGTPVSYTYVDSLDAPRRPSFSGAVYPQHEPFNESGFTRQVELPSKVLQDEYCNWFAQEYPPMLPPSFSPTSLPAAAPAESHSFGMVTPPATLSHSPLTPDMIKEEESSPLFPSENGMSPDWPSPSISAADTKGSETSTMDALLELMTMTPPMPCLPLTSISPQHIPTTQAKEEGHTHLRSPPTTETPLSTPPPTTTTTTTTTSTPAPLPPKIAPRHLPSLSTYMSRRFICPIDAKRFATRASLTAHQRIHTPRPRNHTCRLCGGAYLRKQDLERHMATHISGEKPFRCWICGVGFTRKDALRRHQGKSRRCIQMRETAAAAASVDGGRV
ncbi:hypothetical protein HDU85_001540 [Gaertneriomyces sp. JEL0708]|nr:hypothetical protein HDU85_001540 [Gaertneriomyces sp. JEL0708]